MEAKELRLVLVPLQEVLLHEEIEQKRVDGLLEQLRAAGVQVSRCPIHDDQLKPCRKCGQVFKLAEAERAKQRQGEQRVTHAAWLREQKGDRG